MKYKQRLRNALLFYIWHGENEEMCEKFGLLFHSFYLSWTDTKGKNRDCVHCVFGVLETNQNFDQRLLLQQLDCPCFDTFVFVEPRIEGSTEGQKKQ